LLAVVAAFVLVLGSFTWVLSRQAHRGDSAITQLPSADDQGNIRGVPQPAGPGLTTQPGQPGSGPGVTTHAAPTTGGPPVLGGPNGNPNGPNVLGTPSANQNGPSVVGEVPTMPTGPPVLRGPQGRVPGLPITRAPAAPTTGPPVTAQPPTPQSPTPPLSVSPRPPPETRTEPPKPTLDDIGPYLQRLRVVEQKRRVFEAQLVTIVTNTTFTQALGAMSALNSGEEQQQFPRQAVLQFEAIAREYDNLSFGFQRFTRPVPVSCALLHANYGRALSLMPGIVRTLRNAIVHHDMGSAMLVQQFANGTVDRNFAAADGELTRVTREHGIPKPFDLGSGSSGGLMSPFGP